MNNIKQRAIFNVAIHGSIDWSLIHHAKFKKIYQSACDQAWSPDHDLNWEDQPPGSFTPYTPGSLPISGFSEFESLSPEKKFELGWRCHAMELSELLHGEQIAMIVAAQLINEAPSFTAKMAACSQVSDEARHLDFFTQYMTKFQLPIQPPSTALSKFSNQVVNDSRSDYKCLACQVLLESMAMAKFEEIKRDTTVNVLQNGLKQILREEARHIGTGTHWLKEFHQGLSTDELKVRLRYVLNMLLILSESDLLLTALAKQEGWCEQSLKHHLRIKRQNDVARQMSRRKHIASALTRCGLLTKETRTMIAGLLTDNVTEPLYH